MTARHVAEPSNALGSGLESHRKTRILFVAEGVTLAHLARPLALAKAADTSRFEVSIAVEPRLWRWIDPARVHLLPLASIPPEHFLDRLARGKPLYTLSELERYLAEDRRLIQEVHPDLVVGDFRLTLGTAAELERVPSATIVNAYWTPASQAEYPFPELPIARLLGARLGEIAFHVAKRFAMPLHAVPMWRLRRRHGLTSLGFDLRRVYSNGDMVLLVDPPELATVGHLPANYHWLGPISWAPPVALPAWWTEVPADRPIVYATVGSSGGRAGWDSLAAALGGEACSVIVATAGKMRLEAPPNFFVADYLPGESICRRASLMICNGGSASVHQSLMAGVPVLGLCGNMDQFMSMALVERRGAGRLLRASAATPERLRHEVRSLLADDAARSRAQDLARSFSKQDAPTAFWQLVDRWTRERAATEEDRS